MSELTPYLCVPNARMAVDWHCRVLGAAVSYEPILMEDNRIGHVEPSIGRARLHDGRRVPGADVRTRTVAAAMPSVAVFRDPFGHRWFLNQPS